MIHNFPQRIHYKQTDRGSHRYVDTYSIDSEKIATLEYDVLFEKGWSFDTIGDGNDPTGFPYQTGKLHGLGSENPETGSGENNSRDWSVRVTWLRSEKSHTGIDNKPPVFAIYAYEADRQDGDSGTHYVSRATAEVGKWHNIRLTVNTIDSTATLEVRRGGKLIDSMTVSLHLGSGEIQSFLYSTFFGGGSQEFTPVSDSNYAQFTNFKINSGMDILSEIQQRIQKHYQEKDDLLRWIESALSGDEPTPEPTPDPTPEPEPKNYISIYPENGMYKRVVADEYYFRTIEKLKKDAVKIEGNPSSHVAEMISIREKPSTATFYFAYKFVGNVPEKLHVWAQLRAVKEYGHDSSISISFDNENWIEKKASDMDFGNTSRWPQPEYKNRDNTTHHYQQGPVMISDMYDTPAGMNDLSGKGNFLYVRIRLENKTGGNEDQVAAFNSIGIIAETSEPSNPTPPEPSEPSNPTPPEPSGDNQVLVMFSDTTLENSGTKTGAIDAKINGQWYPFSQSFEPDVSLSRFGKGTVINLNGNVNHIELKKSQIRKRGLNNDCYGFATLKIQQKRPDFDGYNVTRSTFKEGYKAGRKVERGSKNYSIDRKDENFYSQSISKTYNESGRLMIWVDGVGVNHQGYTINKNNLFNPPKVGLYPSGRTSPLPPCSD